MQFVYFIALLVVSYAITVLTASKSKQEQGPTRLNDIKFPVPDEGAPQAVIFGDVWTKDWMVLWVGNYKTEEIHAQGGGGKK